MNTPQDEINKIFERACFLKFFNWNNTPNKELGVDPSYVGDWMFMGEEVLDGVNHYCFKHKMVKAIRAYPKNILDGSKVINENKEVK